MSDTDTVSVVLNGEGYVFTNEAATVIKLRDADIKELVKALVDVIAETGWSDGRNDLLIAKHGR